MYIWKCPSKKSDGLRRGSESSRLLGLRDRIPPVAWVSVDCECSVLSGTGPCDDAITRPEEFCQLWCVCVIKKPHRGGLGPQELSRHEKKVSKDRSALYIRSNGDHSYMVWVERLSFEGYKKWQIAEASVLHYSLHFIRMIKQTRIVWASMQYTGRDKRLVTNIIGQSSSWKATVFSSSSVNAQYFVEDSLPCIKDHAILPCPGTDKFCPRPLVFLL